MRLATDDRTQRESEMNDSRLISFQFFRIVLESAKKYQYCFSRSNGQFYECDALACTFSGENWCFFMFSNVCCKNPIKLQIKFNMDIGHGHVALIWQSTEVVFLYSLDVVKTTPYYMQHGTV